MTGATDPRSAVGFNDVRASLIHFAQGICARHFHIEEAPEMTPALLLGRGLHGDGGIVRLPAYIDVFPLRRHNLAAYRYATLHQLGYLEHGTYDFDLGAVLTAMPLRLAAMFDKAAIDMPAASPLERFCLAWRRPKLLRHVLALLEDLRIDTRIARRYPGARKDRERMAAHLLNARPAPHGFSPAAALLDCAERISLGMPAAQTAEQNGAAPADVLIGLIAPLLRDGASVIDSAHAAIELCLMLEDRMRPNTVARMALPDMRQNAPADDEPAETLANGRMSDALAGFETDGDAADDGADGTEGGKNAGCDPDLLADAARWRTSGANEGMTAEMDASADSTAPGNADDKTDARRDITAPLPIVPSALPVIANGDAAIFRYDEWDYLNQRYLRSWCRLFEKPLRGTDAGFVRDVRKRHGALAARIRRQFSRIRPDALVRRHRMQDGEEIDIDGMIEAAVDRRAGCDGDVRPYMRRDRSNRDTCAAFLLDMSGSTGFPIPTAKAASAEDSGLPDEVDSYPYLYAGGVAPQEDTAPQRRVIDIAKESLTLMCDALQMLGDRHAVFGFSGDGRESVEFFIAKDFGEAWAQRTYASLAAMEPRRATRAGAAIRHAIARLARQPERMKVLIVVSDGYPQDRDYGPDPDDNEYGIQDTARALQEARRRGIRDFCITIDPAGQDYLRRMCAESRYLVIDDVTDLPDQLSKVYRSLTGV